MDVEIILPGTDPAVQHHHDRANEAITALPAFRCNDAQIKLSSWRRVLTAINLDGKDGYAFTGHSLRPGVVASVPVGSLILSVDTSFATADWYVGTHLDQMERSATLYLVEEAGLAALITRNWATWARDILSYLATNPELCEAARVTIGQSRRPY